KKLITNSKKAIQENLKRKQDAYAPLKMAIPHKWKINRQSELEFTLYTAEAQGIRKSMEDAHMYKKIAAGHLIAVFDGHGGVKVAQYAAKKFPTHFSKNLSKFLDPYQAFNHTFSELQTKISRNPKWYNIGTTAAISFIDRNNRIFT